jgi:hypothetical protein
MDVDLRIGCEAVSISSRIRDGLPPLGYLVALADTALTVVCLFR